jgi:hypothetical protein
VIGSSCGGPLDGGRWVSVYVDGEFGARVGGRGIRCLSGNVWPVLRVGCAARALNTFFFLRNTRKKRGVSNMFHDQQKALEKELLRTHFFLLPIFAANGSLPGPPPRPQGNQPMGTAMDGPDAV